MINRLRRKVTSTKLQSGGMPPAPFEQAPLFSRQGLRQRAETARGLYNRLPGSVRGPLNFAGRVVFPRTPMGKAVVYGGTALGAVGGIEGLRNALNPSEKTVIDRINAANPTNTKQLIIGKDISVFGEGLPEPKVSLPDDSNIVTKEKRTLEDDFPGMTGSEIIETVNQQAEDTGIKIEPDAIIENINNANEQNQMLAPDVMLTNINEEDGRPSQDIIEEQTVDAQKGPEGEGIVVDDVTIDEEYKSRDNQELKANQLYIDEYFNQGGDKSLLALSLDKTVGDLMGEGSKKSNKLLLLQLAAGLLSNKTTQGGFRGFLDVLGQSGQQVIPLALSLEAQRRDDEIELKKALLANMKKNNETSKFSLPDKIAKFTIPGDSQTTTARIKTDQFGNIFAMMTDRDGGNPRYRNVTDLPMRILDAPDKDDILATNNKIGLKTRALKGVREALDISVKDPSLIGSPGTIQRTAAIAGDILKSYIGKSKFSDLRTELDAQKEQFLVEQKMRLDDGEISEEDYNEAIKTADNYFDKGLDQIKKGLKEGEGTDLQKQAKLKTIELLTSYALANILKDKDRLAVRDIERAEKLTNQFGLLTSPTEVIARYLILEQQLVSSIKSDIKVAENIGIMPEDIIDYDQAYKLTNLEADKKNAEFKSNIEAIIGSDPELLNKFIDQLGFDKLKVIE
tara:strand:- start:2401 stop:4440 length:2040 start_codon:yes stop_codon:yes gene_type:complete